MRAVMCGVALVVAACGPPNPCSGHQFDRLRRYSMPYAGHWVVARGDTLTFPAAPSMSDRFRLGAIILDTATVIMNRECLFRGQIVFRVPRAETLAVSWFGQPEQAIVSGWPVDLGPFAGVSLAPAGGGVGGGEELGGPRFAERHDPARLQAGRAGAPRHDRPVRRGACAAIIFRAMRGFLVRLLITALGLWVADQLLPGIVITGTGALIVSALVLGVVNALIRPILFFLTLPLTVLTLGLFVLIVNGISLALVAWLVPGFHVAGMWSATLGAVVVGLTSWAASAFVGGSGRIERMRRVEVTGRRIEG